MEIGLNKYRVTIWEKANYFAGWSFTTKTFELLSNELVTLNIIKEKLNIKESNKLRIGAVILVGQTNIEPNTEIQNS
jgi:hypothetical protein